MTTPTDKVCARCGESKQAEAFYRSKRGADGLASECRECAAARQRDRAARVRNMPPVEVDPRRMFYSTDETANICKKSARWVYRRRDAGVLAAHRLDVSRGLDPDLIVSDHRQPPR